VTLVADTNVPVPVVDALARVRFGIVRLSELGPPDMPDREVMKIGANAVRYW